jgi:pilus assembly protein CpaF
VLGSKIAGHGRVPITVASIMRPDRRRHRHDRGKRRVMSIAEITGTQGDIIQMPEIYKYVRTATRDDGTVPGHSQVTGIGPRFR